MKKIYIIFLFFLSGSVLAHNSAHNHINNDFESMMKSMFNQMKMMDMHHKHLFKRTGKKNNEKGWRLVTQSDDKNSIKITITLKGIDKEDLDIHIKKNVLVIRAEKEISGESSHTKHSFMQQFLIPKNIDRSGITAKFEDGVLIVSIPKPTKDNHEIQQITIQWLFTFLLPHPIKSCEAGVGDGHWVVSLESNLPIRLDSSSHRREKK